MFGGFQGSSGFGSPAPSPFGAQPSPFGGMGTSFPQQQQPASPFGATGGTGLFGSSQSNMGISSVPSFGTTTGAFGASTSAFGAQANKPPQSSFSFGQTGAGFGQTGFGTTSPSPFGGAASAASPFGGMSTPGFGASSTPAFGTGGGMFGSMGTGFGAASTPSPFGSSTLGAFGASTPAFGTTPTTPFGGQSAAAPFGSMSTSAFGGFGAASTMMPTSLGTKAMQFQKTKDPDPQSQSQGATGPQYFVSITAMPQYQHKSFEELRYEDYAQGVKGNPNAGVGSPAASPFGTGTGGFGTTTPGFGTNTPAFGATGAFGAASSTSPFGTMSAASPFGAASSPSPFGAATTAAAPFGTPQSSPFGGASTASPFGGTSTGGFGTAAPFGTAGTSFTGVQAANASPFGTSPSPFGTTASQPAFGLGTAAPSPFGSGLAAPSFSSSAFGGTSLFGTQTTASPFGTGALGAASSPSPFGGASSPFSITSAFGGAKPASPSPFGTSSAFAFPSSFSSPGMTGLGGASLFPSFTAPGMGTSAFGQQPQAPPPGIGQSPYGTLPELPTVKMPEPRVGITQRPVSSSSVPSRASPLLRPPSAGARFGVPIQRRPSSAAPSDSGLAGSLEESQRSTASGVDDSSRSDRSTLVVRDNPYRLLIKKPPPGTDSAMASASTPSKTSAGLVPRGRDKDGDVAATPASSRAQENGERGSDLSSDLRHTNGSANGHGTNGHDLDALLPTLGGLRDKDYYTVPSEQQLRELVKREGSKALAALPGFAVGRRGVGEVRALEPVDVRGLRLDRIVDLKHGEVAMYADLAMGEPKPPVGCGLNVPSEITLYNCWRRDKETGEFTKEGPAAMKYEKRLLKVCSDNNSTFISYHLDGGVWKFAVEHFSRYGLPDDWDEDDDMVEEGEVADEDDMDEGPRRVRPRRAVGPGGRAAGAGAPGRATGGPPQGARQLPLLSDAVDDAGLEEELELESPLFAPPLQHALPMQLGMDARQLYDLRESLFPEEPPRETAVPRHGGLGLFGPRPGPSAAPSHSWLPAPPTPLRAPEDSLAPPAASPAALLELSPGGSLAGPISQLNSLDRTKCAQDSALFLGRSFRVGWGPGGVLAHTVVSGGSATGSSVASLSSMARNQNLGPLSPGVALAKIPLSAGMAVSSSNAEQAAFQARLRSRLVALLEVHRTHSKPNPGGGTLGGWAVRSDRRQLLSDMLQQYQAAGEEQLQGPLPRVERLCSQHASHTWELIRVMFEFIEGEDDREILEMGMEVETPRAMLASFKRRANLSALMQRRVAATVEAALETCSSVPEAVLQLLSGHQLAAATALASAHGDHTLATLVAQVAQHQRLQADCRQTLAVWEAAKISPALIDGRRLHIYQALAGTMEGVQPKLSLDWRRAFGMYLWYSCPPSTPLRSVLDAYSQGHETIRGIVPPLPPYLEQAGSASQEGAATPTDLHYQLLSLATEAQGRGVSPGALLRLSGHTPSPLDASLMWHVASVLASIDVLPSSPPPCQVYQLCMSLVALLEAADLPTWSVYVAAHLPDHPEHPGLRERAMRELLSRHCSAWREDREAVAHLVEVAAAREPLEDAKALLDRYSRMPIAEVAHLTAAGQTMEAHAVLCGQAAVLLLGPDPSAPGNAQLAELLAELAPMRGSIPSWSLGGGLMLDYLEALGARPMGGDGHLDMARRLQAAHDWCRQLPPDHREGFLSVLSSISADLSRWLLLDGLVLGMGQPVAAQQLCDGAALSLRPLGSHALMFGLQAAAAQLGACV